MKKRHKELLNLVFGLGLMFLGLVVILVGFYNLAANSGNHPDTNGIIVWFIIPIILILIGYNIYRGKNIGLPKLPFSP